jgi:hypothetical protein
MLIPYVILRKEGTDFWLTDSEAEDVANRIKRALDQLPASK